LSDQRRPVQPGQLLGRRGADRDADPARRGPPGPLHRLPLGAGAPEL